MGLLVIGFPMRESTISTVSWMLPEHLISAARRMISVYSQFSKLA